MSCYRPAETSAQAPGPFAAGMQGWTQNLPVRGVGMSLPLRREEHGKVSACILVALVATAAVPSGAQVELVSLSGQICGLKWGFVYRK